MGLLDDAARNIGLMLHNIGAEVRQGEAEAKARGQAQAQAREHSRKVEEERPAPGVIIRRTTVEEIILAPGVDPGVLQGAKDSTQNPHPNP